MSVLVRDEIELAKAEVSQKVKSIGKGAVAVAAGGVFGVFAIIFALEAAAWALNDVLVPGAGPEDESADPQYDGRDHARDRSRTTREPAAHRAVFALLW